MDQHVSGVTSALIADGEVELEAEQVSKVEASAGAAMSSEQALPDRSDAVKIEVEPASVVFSRGLPCLGDASARRDPDTKAPEDVLMDPDAVVPDVLCSTCKSLFDGSRRWHKGNIWIASRAERTSELTHCEHFQTLGELYRNANKGCHFCAIMHSCIHDVKENSSYLEEIRNRCSLAIGLHGMNLEDFDGTDDHIDLLLSCLWDEFNGIIEFQPRLYVSTDDGKRLLLARLSLWPADKRHTRNLYDNKYGIQSAFNVNWMADKLFQCKENHTVCSTDRIQADIRYDRRGPKRLLDISTICNGELVKLVDYDRLAGDAMYVAVSHRWGDSSQLLLTANTQSMLYDNLPLAQLPRLFQDIGKVAHKLGYNYLWVDTLCIQQDDNQDWQFHADCMSSIYAMSSLNITASGALHHQPLFWPRRNMLALTDMYITATWNQFEQTLLYLRRIPLDNDPLEHQTIASRGWVFQERLFAPRSLHFVNEQIVWECRCALVRNWDEWEVEPHPVRRNQPKRDLIALFESDEPHPDLVLRFWMEQVTIYSRTVTTFEEDRFFALAGAANTLQALLIKTLGTSGGSNYYAGIWEYKIELQLCWHISEGLKEDFTPRPNTYRSPSWSWGSVNGAICFAPDSAYRPEMHWETCACGYVDMNSRSLVRVPAHGNKILVPDSTFGPVKEGSALLLWCNLCRVKISHDDTMAGGPGCDPVRLSFFRYESSGTQPTVIWESGERSFRASVRWDDRATMGGKVDAINEDLFFVPLVFTAGERRRAGIHGCSHFWDVSGTESGCSTSRSGVHARRHSQFYPSSFCFEQFRLHSGLDCRLNASFDKIRFRFCIWALMLKPVKNSPGCYTRIGLADVIIDWSTKNTSSLEVARGFMGAFHVPKSAEEETLMLSKPISGDSSVYEIELI